MSQTSPQEQHQHHSLSGGEAVEMREMRGDDLDWYRIGGMGIANGVERIIGREVRAVRDGTVDVYKDLRWV